LKGLEAMVGFKYFKNRFSHSRTNWRQILWLSQSPEANHASWPDISAKVDLCVANLVGYSLTKEIIDLVIFQGPWEICQNNKLQVKGVHGEKLRTPDLSQQPVLGIKEIPRTGSCEPVEPHHFSEDSFLLK